MKLGLSGNKHPAFLVYQISENVSSGIFMPKLFELRLCLRLMMSEISLDLSYVFFSLKKTNISLI